MTNLRVPVGGNLQDALNAAEGNDTISLAAGGEFVAPQDGFTIPVNSSDAANPIIVYSERITEIPSNKRIDVSDNNYLSRIITNGPYPALNFFSGSAGWRFKGVNITTTPNPDNDHYVSTLVNIGRYVSPAPSAIEFDQCWIHSQEDYTDNPHNTVKILVLAEGNDIKITNSRIASSGAYIGSSNTFDNTAAIMMINGPGPMTVDNSFISAWFTPLFMGGGDLSTANTGIVSNASMASVRLSNVGNLHVGDLIAFATKPATTGYTGYYYEVAKVVGISGNLVTFIPWAGSIGNKPDCTGDCGIPLTQPPIEGTEARWNGDNPQDVYVTRSTFHINPVVAEQIYNETQRLPKGYFEIKAGKNINFEGCQFTGWSSTFAMTQHNQTGPHGGPSPWSVIQDVTIKNCLYQPSRKFGSQLIGLLLEDNVGTSVVGGNILFENNVFMTGGWVGDFFGGKGVKFKHNTILNDVGWANGRLLNVNYIPIDGFEFTDNIVFNNEYGINFGSGGSLNSPLIKGNVLITGELNPYRPNCSNFYPVGNYCPTNISQVGFVDPINNLRLRSDSQYKNKATDGMDIGANIDQLLTALGNVEPVYNLIVTNGTGSGSYVQGSIVHITATPPSGKVFSSWTGNVSNSLAASTVVVVNNNTTVTANFKDLSTFNLTGEIKTLTGVPVYGVKVFLSDGRNVNTNHDGVYTFIKLKTGTYKVIPGTSAKYIYSPSYIKITIGTTTVLNFTAVETSKL